MTGKHTISSVCPYCAVGCGLKVDVVDGVASRVRGDGSHPANLGRLCNKGVLLPQMLRTGDRLLYPHIRSSLQDDFRRATWDQALDFIAGRLGSTLRDHGPQSVAFYGSGQLPTEDYYLLGKLAKGFLGTNNQDTNSRLCMTSAAAAYGMAFGNDGPPCAHSDIEHSDCFLILGANIAECHPVLFQRVRARKAARPDRVKIIVVDPRRTPTAAIADHHLQVRPGADVALANALLHVVIREGLVDERFVAGRTEGFESVRDRVVTAYSPEQVAEGCGVSPDDIRAAARAYGRAATALTMYAMGANQSSSGVDKNLSLINLALATGNIGKPGAGPFSLTGQPNAMGGREAGGMAQSLPGHRLVADPGHRAEMEHFWGLPPGAISAQRGLTAVEIFEAMEQGAVKALWVACTNPVASMPNGGQTVRSLRRADLVVVQDAYHPTETGNHAHVLLPAAQWSEREAVMTNNERRVCLLEKAGDPPGEALPDWQIFCRVAHRMGFGKAFDYAGSADVFAEFVATTRHRDLDMTGLTYEGLRASRGIQWPAPAGKPEGSTHLYEGGGFSTSSGRARFHVVELHAAAEPVDEQFPLVLTTGRVKNQWHTLTRTGKIPKLTGSSPAPFVQIHPDDAAALGVADGWPVEVRSRRGAVRLKAAVSTDIRPGTVFAPFHWGPLWSPEGSVNDLTTPAYDPISKQPELKYCAVRLTPVTAESATGRLDSAGWTLAGV